MNMVALPQFDGPLDLLLSLVRKEKLDITNLPIAEVTRQYLEYLHAAKELDIDLGAEFAYMAASLILIKSQSLLPPDRLTGGSEPDPRDDLVRELLSHEQIKLAAEFLREKLEEAVSTWSSAPNLQAEAQGQRSGLNTQTESLDLFQVLLLAKKALARADTGEPLILEPDAVTIGEMEQWLMARLAGCEPGEVVEAGPLLEEQRNRDRKIYLFLAMLDCANTHKISLAQAVPFGPLLLQTNVDANLCDPSVP